MNDTPRLIERAFPLKQTSLDSVHEKNVRHGHISTLHIWPARRPLAACRAALIATLLPDPGTEEKRKELCEKIGGTLQTVPEKKKMPDGSIVERQQEETVGGILRWGRETENAAELDWFRQEIRKAYGGRAPKVLDPFAGGGAIPLEAMRLGCEATAVDINPVAWFVQKCTLEYPQKLAGKTLPLPEFILEDEVFMESFYKAHPHLVGRTKKTTKQKTEEINFLPGLETADSGRIPKADLTWHVRAWGKWVLNNARKELARFYPTYADFEPLDKVNAKPFEPQPLRLVTRCADGMPDLVALNKDFTKDYLDSKANPRWVAKPTVAYLWARAVTCKNCRATLPLLKTRWLCNKEKKHILLTMEPNVDKTGVVFGIDTKPQAKGGNATQKKEAEKRLAAGTMSRSGATCPCCGTIMTMEDIRLEGKAGRLGATMTCVVIDGLKGKEYRLPEEHELQVALEAEKSLDKVFSQIPFGMPEEALPSSDALGFRVPLYGFDQWKKLFTNRQLLAMGTFVKCIRSIRGEVSEEVNDDWCQAIAAYLVCGFDRMLDFNSSCLSWITSVEAIGHTFARYALPITWDYSEAAPINAVRGGYDMCLDACMESLETISKAANEYAPIPHPLNQSAKCLETTEKFDIVLTDPPYYDAIPYSDLMDYFYVWLRRCLSGLSPVLDRSFAEALSPKWVKDKNDGELIDDSSRHGNDKAASKAAYENGMAKVFELCYGVLADTGRLVVVFAHKHPDAWETLASAIIRAGFVVDGSWPIQTEQVARMRAQSSAALASSVWLVCKKRPVTARPGWDTQVLEEMRTNIRDRLREYWDAGIRGPDFVWAATGPAMEAYSRHPLVKKANEPGPMTVTEFLSHVRKMVVDFVVGRVLTGEASETDASDRLDEVTAYYLLHRHDFGMDEAPAGACILYAVSCGLSDRELSTNWDLITFKGLVSGGEGDEEDASDDESGPETSGKIRLKAWAQRKGKSMGYEAPGGRPIPLIDRIHCLMHLWKAGDLSKVDEYLDSNGLRRQELFKRLLQSLIELSPHGTEERSLLESLSNHLGARGATYAELGLSERS
jgi:adenine-specific DNA methylase